MTPKWMQDWIPDRPNTWKKSIAQGISMTVLLTAFVGLGSLVGFYWGTGTLPMVTNTVAVFPVVEGPVTTVEKIEVFLEEDETELAEYGMGQNCVEYALLAARNAHWKGLPAEVAGFTFEDGTLHTVLVFRTGGRDEAELVFVEPQDDHVIKNVQPGLMYNGKRLKEVHLLVTSWVPLIAAAGEVE